MYCEAWPEDGKASRSKRSRKPPLSGALRQSRSHTAKARDWLNAPRSHWHGRARWQTCSAPARPRIVRCSNRRSPIWIDGLRRWKIPKPKSQIPNPKPEIPNPKPEIPNPKQEIPRRESRASETPRLREYLASVDYVWIWDLEFGIWDLRFGIYSRRRSGVSRGMPRRSAPLRRSVNCSSMNPPATSSRSSSD